MASKQELEVAVKSIADGRGFDETNDDITKTVINANKLTEKQYNVVVKAVEEGKNIAQVSQELKQLEQQEREVAQAAGEAERASGGFGQGLSTLQAALGALGIALTAQQLMQFADAAREAARAEADAVNTLETAAEGIADYEQALNLGRASTMGMASDAKIAASEAVLFGTGLAKNAQDAAELASAGTILSEVFKSAGASQELFVRLLSSGSVQLYNNFGITAQMVQQQQKHIESTTKLTGEEAKAQALKEVLINQSIKYKDALSQESIQAAQSEAAQENFMAAAGTFINELDQATGVTTDLTKALNIMTEGLRNNQGELGGWTVYLREAGDMNAQLTQRMKEAGIGFDQVAEATEAANQVAEARKRTTEAATEAAAAEAEALGPIVTSLDAMGFSAIGAAEAHDPLIAKMVEATHAAKQAAAAYRESEVAEQSMALAGTYGGAPDTFTQEQNLIKQQNANDQSKKYRDQKAADEATAAKEAEQAARQSANQMKKVITDAANDLGSAISGAVSGAISGGDSWVSKALGIDAEGAERAEEDVRRMAAVALGGLADVNTAELAKKLQGVDAAQAFVQAVTSGNDAAVREEAKKLATKPIVELYDAALIAQQVEQQLNAQNLKAQLDAKVNALLGAKGLPAIQNVTQQVGQAVTATGDATATVGGQVEALGATTDEVGPKMQKSYEGVITSLERINQLTRIAIGLTDTWNGKIKEAGASFDTVGVGASNNGVPTQAQQKMGPTRGL